MNKEIMFLSIDVMLCMSEDNNLNHVLLSDKENNYNEAFNYFKELLNHINYTGDKKQAFILFQKYVSQDNFEYISNIYNLEVTARNFKYEIQENKFFDLYFTDREIKELFDLCIDISYFDNELLLSDITVLCEFDNILDKYNNFITATKNYNINDFYLLQIFIHHKDKMILNIYKNLKGLSYMLFDKIEKKDLFMFIDFTSILDDETTESILMNKVKNIHSTYEMFKSQFEEFISLYNYDICKDDFIHYFVLYNIFMYHNDKDFLSLCTCVNVQDFFISNKYSINNLF